VCPLRAHGALQESFRDRAGGFELLREGFDFRSDVSMDLPPVRFHCVLLKRRNCDLRIEDSSFEFRDRSNVDEQFAAIENDRFGEYSR